MIFRDSVYDFGDIKQGDKVEHDFAFTNEGTLDLVITNSGSSCGCTVPSYPKGPIPPGNSGIVKVSFDSKGKSGREDKVVTLLTNCQPNTQILTIHANVLTPNNQ